MHQDSDFLHSNLIDIDRFVKGWVYSQKNIQMITRYLVALLTVLLLPLAGVAQLTMQITDIPANTPDGEDIYVAGNFNGWAPGDDSYILTETSPGLWEITLDIAPGLLEFKFTRGSWPTVEGNASGGYRPNRTYDYSGGEQLVSFEILSWEGSGANSTASDNVFLLDEDFNMPQLGRDRRIWIYLPPDYDDSGKDYPVLYMHDGQNLFDIATAFSGEWEVDESLNALFENGDEGIIVVGIDNGGTHRLDEYSPWVNPQYGGGEGQAYVEFIIETLKPYIDEQYRTKSGRAHTGIMGSSMGGLISLYAAIEHQDVFSKAGIFSASFWFSDEVYTHVSSTGKQADMRIYMIAGALEGSGGGQVADMNAMYDTLLDAGFDQDEVLAIEHPDGTHSEWYWAREFSDAYQWLWATTSSILPEEMKQTDILVYPNPIEDTIILKGLPMSEKLSFQLLDMNGRTILKERISAAGRINVAGLPSGNYLLVLYEADTIIATKQISK